ncbi:phenylacetate-CoA oxygenase subunit PaaI [Escherichia coli]|nr:phenylacetate-CoA oxygenase subunit PaaI [Escherichia coli]
MKIPWPSPDERQFSNLLMVEQPNGNFADTVHASISSMHGMWRSLPV